MQQLAMPYSHQQTELNPDAFFSIVPKVQWVAWESHPWGIYAPQEELSWNKTLLTHIKWTLCGLTAGTLHKLGSLLLLYNCGTSPSMHRISTAKILTHQTEGVCMFSSYCVIHQCLFYTFHTYTSYTENSFYR